MLYSWKKSTFADVIELERHIEILLLSNDCVIVPDFGGFMAHHVDARYDKDDHLFLPPLRTLGFNPQLKMNDSLLAQSYIEAYDISYPEAIKRIEDEVRELKQRLENEGTYELNDLGTISMNEDGHYEFQPCEAGLLTPELYGLSSFEINPLSTGSTKKVGSGEATLASSAAQATEKVPTLTVETKEMGAQEKEEPTLTTTVFDTEEEEKGGSTFRVHLYRNVAIACIALLVFLLIPSNLGNSDDSSSLLSKVDTGMLTRIFPKSVTTGTTQLEAALKKDTVKESKNNSISHSTEKTTKASQELKDEEAPYFCLVLASRVTKKNAAAYVDQLRQKGYQTARVLPRERGAKVIYGSYKTENEAYNVLNRMCVKPDFSEAWVMCVQPNQQRR